MPTIQPRRNLDEIAQLAEHIFDGQIRPALRSEDEGKFVAIDVDSGEYEVDQDDQVVIARLRARKPKAEIWLMRAGYPAAYRMGVVR